jgi:hypothetical protein
MGLDITDGVGMIVAVDVVIPTDILRSCFVMVKDLLEEKAE